MKKLRLPVKKLPGTGDMPLPSYMSDGASGLDLAAAVDGEIELAPLDRILVPTGIAIELPEGYEAQVRPRSGLAVKYGITILNSPGTIDEDYRGEIRVIVINLSRSPFVIRRGDRIAQLVISKRFAVEPFEVEEISATRRGSGGFGHTGHSIKK